MDKLFETFLVGPEQPQIGDTYYDIPTGQFRMFHDGRWINATSAIIKLKFEPIGIDAEMTLGCSIDTEIVSDHQSCRCYLLPK